MTKMWGDRHGRITEEMHARLAYVSEKKEYSFDERRKEMLEFISRYYTNKDNYSTEDLVQRLDYMKMCGRQSCNAGNVLFLAMVLGLWTGAGMVFLYLAFQPYVFSVRHAVYSAISFAGALIVVLGWIRYRIWISRSKRREDPYCTNLVEFQIIYSLLSPKCQSVQD